MPARPVGGGQCGRGPAGGARRSQPLDGSLQRAVRGEQLRSLQRILQHLQENRLGSTQLSVGHKPQDPNTRTKSHYGNSSRLCGLLEDAL